MQKHYLLFPTLLILSIILFSKQTVNGQSNNESTIFITSMQNMQTMNTYLEASNKDVLKRMLDGIKYNHNKSEIVVRITGDDILIDPNYLDLTIQHHLINNLQYTDAKKLPSGIDAEIFNTRLLKLIYKISKDTSGTEYLTYYINDHRKQFSTGALKVSSKYKNKIRLTLDNKNDFIVIKTFLEQMSKAKKLFNYNFQDLISFYNKNRKLFRVNISSKTKKVDINTDFDWKKII